MRREDREDAVAVDDARRCSSTASIRSPSPSNATPRSSAFSMTVRCSARRSVAPHSLLMFVPSGLDADRRHVRAELLERARRDLGVRAVGAVDADCGARSGRSRSARRCARGSCRSRSRRGRSCRRRAPPRRAAPRSPPRSSSVSFCPCASKNLTPLYSGGLCDAVITAPTSSASSATAGVGSTPASTALPPADAIPRASASSSSTPGGARVAPDEDATASGPQRDGLAELLDELGRQRSRRRSRARRRCRSTSVP